MRITAAVVLGLMVVVSAWVAAQAVESRVAAPASPAVTAAPASSAAPADAQAQRRAREEARRLAADQARVRRTLATAKPKLDFESTAIKDVLKYLAEVGNFSVVFSPELEAAGLDLSTRVVTIRAQGMTYEDAINLILPRECGYRVEAGYILITTLEKSWLPLQTKTYSIKLTMAEIPDFTDAPRFDVATVLSQAGQRSGGGGGNIFTTPTATTPDTAGRASSERITEMIKKFVKNQTDHRIAPWDDEGGPATVQYMGGQLVISQTEQGHRAVAQLLAKIE